MKRSPMPARKTALKAKSGKTRKRPTKPCSWSNRCYRRPSVIVSEDERYCKTHAKDVADRYVGLFVKERDRWTCQNHQCQATHHTAQIQWAHIISRGAPYIRYDPENSIALCARCHQAFTVAPARWDIFLARRYPGLRDKLALLEATHEASGHSVDLAEIITYYRAKVAA
jgi:hypothetical protein